MESTSSRLIQSWQTPRLKGQSWSGLLQQRHTHLAVAGCSLVFACACLAELLNPNTAGLAVAAASWGFLTLAHWSRSSAQPVWRSLLVLAPFLLLATLYVSGLGSGSARYEEVKRVGSLSGLVALGTALHLTASRRSTLRRLLVIVCALGILHVGLMSMAQFVQANAERGLIERFHDEPHLVAMSVVVLCLAIGLLGQRKDLRASRRSWLVFGCLPLVMPLALSPSGWLLAGCILLLVFYKGPTKKLVSRWRWLMPLAILILLIASVSRTWWQATPEMWQAYWQEPLLGTGAKASGAYANMFAEAPGWMIALREYGILGVFLLGATPFLYLMKPLRSSPHGKPQVLRDWCWIGCGLMALLAVWSNPFHHHGVAVFTVILFVAGQRCHRRAASSKRKRRGDEGADAISDSIDRTISHDAAAVLRRDKATQTELRDIKIRPNLARKVIYSATGPNEDLITEAKAEAPKSELEPSSALPASVKERTETDSGPRIWRRKNRIQS